MGALAWLEFLNFAGTAAFLITTEPRLTIIAEHRDLTTVAAVEVRMVLAEHRDLTTIAPIRVRSVVAEHRDLSTLAAVSVRRVVAEHRDLTTFAPDRGVE
jgi:hypothetical protein